MIEADWHATLSKGAKALGLPLSRFHSRCFYTHMCEMRHWNRRINLTAINDPKEIAAKHFLDAIAPFDRIPEQARLLDVGSGAGFPGLPLKVMRPGCQVTLVDSARKKVNFLRHVVRRLELNQVTVHHGRIEAFAEVSGNEKPFDIIVSRAFTGAAELTRKVLPLIIGGATLMVWKGPDVRDELRSLEVLSDALEGSLAIAVEPYRLPLVNADRHLIAVRMG